MLTHIDRHLRAQAKTEGGDGFGPHVKAKVDPKGRTKGEPEIVIPIDQLPKAEVAFAQGLAATVWNLQWRDAESIMVLEGKLEAKRANVGEASLQIIREAVKSAGNDLRYAYAHAVAMYAVLEQSLKSLHKEATKAPVEAAMSEVCPSLTTYKSDHLRALKKGVDPNERDKADALVYSTAADYRQAGKETKPRPQDGSKGKVSVVPDLVKRAGLNPELSASVGVLIENLSKLTEAEIPDAVSLLKAFANTVATMHADFIKAHPPVATATTGDAKMDKEAAEAIAEDNAKEEARQTAQNGRRNARRGRKTKEA